MTDWLGLVPIFVCLIFAGVGFVQLMQRKSPFKVDLDIILLGVYYVFVIFGYLLFETVPINYRPVLIDGFLVPALYEKVGLNKALAISNLFWCCWHLPILIFGDYMSGTPVWYKLPAFILCIFPVGVMAGLLAIRSKSLWPAAFLHAAHNNYNQTVFGIITIGGADRMYFVSETGILTILCAWTLAIALYFWTKKQLQARV